MSALSRKTIKVELADGTAFEVRTVNADQLAYEDTRAIRKWPLITDGGIQRWHTFLAWKAATRQGLYAGKYEQFVEDAVDVDAAEDEPVDPTPPGQSGS